MSNLESKGFIVEFYGDRSVGIFNQQWSITGDFDFDSQDELNNFKLKIIEAFSYCSDTPIGVISFEDRQAQIKGGF